jgi:hypothetical protein
MYNPCGDKDKALCLLSVMIAVLHYKKRVSAAMCLARKIAHGCEVMREIQD